MPTVLDLPDSLQPQSMAQAQMRVLPNADAARSIDLCAACDFRNTTNPDRSCEASSVRRHVRAPCCVRWTGCAQQVTRSQGAVQRRHRVDEIGLVKISPRRGSIERTDMGDPNSRNAAQESQGTMQLIFRAIEIRTQTEVGAFRLCDKHQFFSGAKGVFAVLSPEPGLRRRRRRFLVACAGAVVSSSTNSVSAGGLGTMPS